MVFFFLIGLFLVFVLLLRQGCSLYYPELETTHCQKTVLRKCLVSVLFFPSKLFSAAAATSGFAIILMFPSPLSSGIQGGICKTQSGNMKLICFSFVKSLSACIHHSYLGWIQATDIYCCNRYLLLQEWGLWDKIFRINSEGSRTLGHADRYLQVASQESKNHRVELPSWGEHSSREPVGTRNRVLVCTPRRWGRRPSQPRLLNKNKKWKAYVYSCGISSAGCQLLRAGMVFTYIPHNSLQLQNGNSVFLFCGILFVQIY